MFSLNVRTWGGEDILSYQKKIYYLAAEDSISFFIYVYMFGGNRLVCFFEK